MIHFLKKTGSKPYKSIPKMWELPQIMILQINSKIVGTHTFRKFFSIFLRRAHVNKISKIFITTDCLSVKNIRQFYY